MVIIKDRGKQYKVNVGDVIKLPKLNGLKTGQTFFFNIVFIKMQRRNNHRRASKTYCRSKSPSQIKDKKQLFKKRRRHNYKRKIGHIQLTLLKIDNITNKSNKK